MHVGHKGREGQVHGTGERGQRASVDICPGAGTDYSLPSALPSPFILHLGSSEPMGVGVGDSGYRKSEVCQPTVPEECSGLVPLG